MLHIFVSSTALDLSEYRKRAIDAVLEIGHHPVGMEWFNAGPGKPTDTCREKVAGCDAVIVLVAHRYGYVPSQELGGDGERSITRLEVEIAEQLGKPVLAFLVDPNAPWPQAHTEQHRFQQEPPDTHAEILAAIRGLNDFRSHLEKHYTRGRFTDPNDLYGKVTAALTEFIRSTSPVPTRLAKVWRPRICYPLQPAPHFQGRERLCAELLEWALARVTPDRVVSIVAVGGTGKTALSERVLAELDRSRHAPNDEPGPHYAECDANFGILVWSFYENPRTEEFLRTACEYFTGEMPTSAGGLLERLQVALTGDEPHLLVLDGLERVQTEGTTGRPRGELEDPQLRRLVRWLAAGQGTRTRALVTSRFPLMDLDDWKHAGHHEERLEDLEPVSARAVLRGWGVKGDDATLDGLAAPLGYHALSVAVLGSYLGKLWGGDPTKAPTFDRGELSAADPKAAKLTRILTHYAEKLPDAERDLLARLSTFPRGVTVEFLGFLIDAGGQIAGTLSGCNQIRLLTLLDQLRGLGLVFRYDTAQGTRFSAHPFLREYFRGLLGFTKPEEIHEAVRSRLAPSLESRPAKRPIGRAILDQYEVLIEHTRLAGKAHEAYELYESCFGYQHLGWVIGDNTRGQRIVSGFSPNGKPGAVGSDLSDAERWRIAEDWGLFSRNLGDLAASARALAAAAEIARFSGQAVQLAITFQDQADVELLAGRLPNARNVVNRATEIADETWIIIAGFFHTYLATALVRLGELKDGYSHFEIASDYQWDSSSFAVYALRRAEFELLTGNRKYSAIQAGSIRALATQKNWSGIAAWCDVILGLASLLECSSDARRHLETARNYGSLADHPETQIRCYHLAAEIARAERAYDLARSEAEAGIHLADTCGFGHYSIELRLALARAQFDAGDPKAALQRAREALDRSVHPECQYAWGEADALHLCGVAHARLGEVELASQRLTEAVSRRERLTHPGLSETSAELARLSGSHCGNRLRES